MSANASQLLPQLFANQRRDAVNDAIDRLQATLEGARTMPSWAMTLVVVTSLICAIILLHVLALMTFAPCLWAMWKRRNESAPTLLEEEQETEMPPAAEEEREE